MGGKISAYTDKELVMYQTKFPTDKADFCTKFLRELVFNPQMSRKAFIKEKGIITAELRRNIENPVKHRWNVLRKFIWKDHPFGINTLGTFKSIKQITYQDLKQYYDHYYRPNYSILVIAGNIKRTKAMKMAITNFGDIKQSENNPPHVPPPTQALDKHVHIEEQPVKQAHIQLSFDTNGHGESSPIWPQIILLNRIIGNNIFHKFVYDLGYSYSARSHAWLVKNSGNIVITVETPPKNTTKTVSLIVDELNKTIINRQSVQEARAGVISNMFLGLADTDQYADFIGMWELYNNKVKSPDKVKKDFKAVSVRDLQKLKESVVRKQNAAMIVLGPVSSKRKEQYENMLAFE
jgi:predicted Zn-dependent peptidase